MASPEKRQRIRHNRTEAAGASGVSEPDTAQEQPKKKLDSIEEQERILNPQPLVTTVGGVEVKLYELPAKQVRGLTGLLMQILGEIVTRPGSVLLRLQGLLASNDDYRGQFISYVARATVTPDAKPEQLFNLGAIASEIEEKATYAELGALLVRMNELNHILEGNRPN